MSVEIAWKQNILVTDFHLLKSLLVVLGFGSQAFVCGFSRQNINSVVLSPLSIASLWKLFKCNALCQFWAHWNSNSDSSNQNFVKLHYSNVAFYANFWSHCDSGSSSDYRNGYARLSTSSWLNRPNVQEASSISRWLIYQLGHTRCTVVSSV